MLPCRYNDYRSKIVLLSNSSNLANLHILVPTSMDQEAFVVNKRVVECIQGKYIGAAYASNYEALEEYSAQFRSLLSSCPSLFRQIKTKEWTADTSNAGAPDHPLTVFQRRVLEVIRENGILLNQPSPRATAPRACAYRLENNVQLVLEDKDAHESSCPIADRWDQLTPLATPLEDQLVYCSRSKTPIGPNERYVMGTETIYESMSPFTALGDTILATKRVLVRIKINEGTTLSKCSIKETIHEWNQMNSTFSGRHPSHLSTTRVHHRHDVDSSYMIHTITIPKASIFVSTAKGAGTVCYESEVCAGDQSSLLENLPYELLERIIEQCKGHLNYQWMRSLRRISTAFSTIGPILSCMPRLCLNGETATGPPVEVAFPHKKRCLNDMFARVSCARTMVLSTIVCFQENELKYCHGLEECKLQAYLVGPSPHEPGKDVVLEQLSNACTPLAGNYSSADHHRYSTSCDDFKVRKRKAAIGLRLRTLSGHYAKEYKRKYQQRLCSIDKNLLTMSVRKRQTASAAKRQRFLQDAKDRGFEEWSRAIEQGAFRIRIEPNDPLLRNEYTCVESPYFTTTSRNIERRVVR